MRSHELPRLTLGGLPIARATRTELAQALAEDCRMRDRTAPPRLSIAINGQALALYHRDNRYKSLIDSADILDADGMPLVFASRLFHHPPLPERTSTTDFFHDAARTACREGLSFYLLGGTTQENEAACAAVRAQYPTLKLLGARDGYWPAGEEAALMAELRALKPDILWLALGKPREEEWALAHRADLAGVGWIKTCGGLFKFLGGIDSRAPGWMQKTGLEWLYRVAREPRRLGWRYLTTNPIAAWYLLTRSK